MEALRKDIKRGDLASVQARIREDHSLINAGRNEWPYTPLRCAYFYGHLQIIRYLLGEGAEVNNRDGHGCTVLHSACYNGGAVVVQLLLEAGADAVTPGEDGLTPLMRAAQGCDVTVVRALLAHGCGDVDARDKDGLTALYWAACNADLTLGVPRLLLEAGADWTFDESSALSVARCRRDFELVAVLEVSNR
jgi:ankyrin repeat protein